MERKDIPSMNDIPRRVQPTKMSHEESLVSAANERVERVAKAIYLALNGDPENGFPARWWKTDAPWDSNPNELCEWERDEYRAIARAAIAEM